ncbi:M20/M25/M40 family metallo-hydrolase [Gemmatimonadota bacterium]
MLSAHFDHVGIGEANAEGDSIYNGADDDASGTSALIEVARAFQSMPRPPRRSVLFLAVSGEEKGLLGSAHYASEPTVPIGGIVANINLDMIGRNAPDTVIAVGQEYTSLGEMSRRIASHHPELGLTVAPDPDPSEQAFFRSDHLVFVKKDIPAIFFTTWDHEDYHQPSDEADAIDSDKAARVARLTFLLTWHVGEEDQPPSWNEGAIEEVHEILENSPF